jgi:hypothetical protein
MVRSTSILLMGGGFETLICIPRKSLCVSLKNHVSLNIGAFLFMQCKNLKNHRSNVGYLILNFSLIKNVWWVLVPCFRNLLKYIYCIQNSV